MVPDASPRRPRARTGLRATGASLCRGFTLIEMLTVVAALIILLGLMVSLAGEVRRRSWGGLTKALPRKLDVLRAQSAARHKQLPQVTPLIETRAAGHAASQLTS